MYEGKSNDNNTKQLYIFSAFPDCLDLSQGQERPYTILTEERENIKTGQKDHLFVHPNYVTEENVSIPQLQKQNAKNNINQFSVAPLPPTGGAAVLAPSRLSVGQAVSSFFGKIKQFFEDKTTSNRRLIKEMQNTLSKRDEQLAAKNSEIKAKDNEIAQLKKDNIELSKQLDEAKRPKKEPVLTATKQTKIFSQGLDDFAKRVHSENAQKKSSSITPPKPKSPKH